MDNNNSGIYQIRNWFTGKVYIGYTINFEKRFKEHQNALKGNYHHSKSLQDEYNIYGPEKYRYEKLEIVEPDDHQLLNQREEYYKQLCRSYSHNIIMKDCKFPEERNKKISISMKGRKITWGQKISDNKERAQKISESHMGMKYSDERNKKISNNKERAQHIRESLTIPLDINEIKRLYSEGKTQKYIGDLMGVSESTIYDRLKQLKHSGGSLDS